MDYDTLLPMKLTGNWFFWALLSAIFAAWTALFAKGGVQRMDSDVAMFIRTGIITIGLCLTLLVMGKFKGQEIPDGKSSLFLFLSAVGTGASWICYFRALKLGEAARVTAIDKLSLVFIAVLSVVIFHERLSLPQWAGLGLVVAGTVLMTRGV